MTTHACRNTFGNCIKCMRCASRLLDARDYIWIHTHTPGHHHAILSVSVSLTYSPSCLGQESEMTIRSLSRCHLPPLSTTPRLNLHTVPSMLNVKQGSCEYQFSKSFGMARQGNEPRSSDCKADDLTTTPSLLPLHHFSYHCTITAQTSVAEPASGNAQISINKKMIVLSSKHLLY